MAPKPHVVEDCRGVLQVLSDGTVVQSRAAPYAVEDRDDGRVEWRDAVYDGAQGALGVRMYRPRRLRGSGNRGRDDGEKLLPVLAYFHGGGFCIGSCAWPSVHACCLRFADEVPAVVLSFDYRLAPEHRIPAAHEDAAAALLWLRDRLAPAADDDVGAWIADSGADPERVFVSGDSAGGNMAHHMAVRFRHGGAPPRQDLRLRAHHSGLHLGGADAVRAGHGGHRVPEPRSRRAVQPAGAPRRREQGPPGDEPAGPGQPEPGQPGRHRPDPRRRRRRRHVEGQPGPVRRVDEGGGAGRGARRVRRQGARVLLEEPVVGDERRGCPGDQAIHSERRCRPASLRSPKQAYKLWEGLLHSCLKLEII